MKRATLNNMTETPGKATDGILPAEMAGTGSFAAHYSKRVPSPLGAFDLGLSRLYKGDRRLLFESVIRRVKGDPLAEGLPA